MADLSPGLALAQRLDERFAQAADRRVNERQAVQSAQDARAEVQRAEVQASETRANRDVDERRRLDAEQQLRDQQLQEDLRRIDEARQAALDATAEGAAPAPRGSFLDVIA